MAQFVKLAEAVNPKLKQTTYIDPNIYKEIMPLKRRGGPAQKPKPKPKPTQIPRELQRDYSNQGHPGKFFAN